MNWKKLYEKLKVGDRVQFIKHNPNCRKMDCIECKGANPLFGRVERMGDKSSYGNTFVRWDVGAGCNIPEECLKKVL